MNLITMDVVQEASLNLDGQQLKILSLFCTHFWRSLMMDYESQLKVVTLEDFQDVKMTIPCLCLAIIVLEEVLHHQMFVLTNASHFKANLIEKVGHVKTQLALKSVEMDSL